VAHLLIERDDASPLGIDTAGRLLAESIRFLIEGQDASLHLNDQITNSTQAMGMFFHLAFQIRDALF